LAQAHYCHLRLLNRLDFSRFREVYSFPMSRHPHLFIVDDEPADAEFILEALRDIGIEAVVETASNGAEAWQRINKIGRVIPDVILVDYRMPVMDGTSFCKLLAADAELRNVPVIMITGHILTPEQRAKLPIDELLAKPTDWAENMKLAEHLRECYFDNIRFRPRLFQKKRA
jgi:CheY-like chemotaxis protein